MVLLRTGIFILEKTLSFKNSNSLSGILKFIGRVKKKRRSLEARYGDIK
jgi:hypothetical protein